MLDTNSHRDAIKIDHIDHLSGKDLFDTIIDAIGLGTEISGVRLEIIKITREMYMTKFIWIETRLIECGISLEIV